MDKYQKKMNKLDVEIAKLEQRKNKIAPAKVVPASPAPAPAPAPATQEQLQQKRKADLEYNFEVNY